MQPSPSANVDLVVQVFPTWWITIPATFAQTYLEEDGYWHAWDEHRSVSLSSLAVTDAAAPVDADMIAREFPPEGGTLVEALPRGCTGWAVEADTEQPARASRALSGMLFADGRVLVATITSDDPAWRLRTWTSIRFYPQTTTPHRPNRREQRRARRVARRTPTLSSHLRRR